MRLRTLFEKVTGYRAHRFNTSIALIDTREHDAWFFLPVQLKHLINSQNIDLVLDVGANVGQFGKRIRESYSGDMISFEPVASAFAALATAARNDPRWKIFNVALGAERGRAPINVAGATKFSSLLPSNDFSVARFGEEATTKHVEMIEIHRLDQFLAEHVPDSRHRRILLKMDTQGYDLQVFAGAGTVMNAVAAMLSEVSLIPIYEGMPRWTDVIASYEQAGFGVTGMFPVNWDSDQVIEFDCLMVRRNIGPGSSR